MTTQNQSGLTRRSIVSSLAVALPAAAMASTSLSSPAMATPLGEPDPILAAIDAFRIADESERAALKEYCRREEIVKREMGHLTPGIPMFRPAGHLPGQPDVQYSEQAIAYSHEQIDEFCPHNLNPEFNEYKHKSFAKLVRVHDEIMGDSARVLDEATAAAMDACEVVIETAPTTMAGVFALLRFQRELPASVSQRLEGEHFAYMAASLEEALLTMQAQA